MPFDPTLPANNSPNSSAQMRTQLNGLKDLIDAVSGVTSAQVDAVNTLPAGSPASVAVSVSGTVLHLSFDLPQGDVGPPGTTGSSGNDGAPGAPFTNFVVDGVTTLNPGEPATVQTSFDGNAVHLNFGIPRGSEGPTGANGSNGNDGGQGAQGPPGQNGNDGAAGAPFTNFVVDTVNALPPGSPPTVSASFDGTAVRLNFGIAQGADGTPGTNGSNGSDGGPGPQGPQGPPFANAVIDNVTTLNAGDPATVNVSFDGMNVHFTFGIPRGPGGNDGSTGQQGPPGEVSLMQLNSAIADTSHNSNSVSTLNMTVSDPPTQGEMQAIADKLDELILALRR